MPVEKPDYDEIRQYGDTFTVLVNRSCETLGAEAIGAYYYLLSKPQDWIIRPMDVRRRFSWGRDKWLKVAKELRGAGLLFDQYEKDGKGKILKRTLYIGSQPLDSIGREIRTKDESIGRVCLPTAEPTVGESDPLQSKDSLQSKDNYKGLDLSGVPEGWRDDLKEFIDHRKTIKKPLTQRALVRFVNKIHKCVHAGIAFEKAIHMTIDRGWSDINPEWIKNSGGQGSNAANYQF